MSDFFDFAKEKKYKYECPACNKEGITVFSAGSFNIDQTGSFSFSCKNPNCEIFERTITIESIHLQKVK